MTWAIHQGDVLAGLAKVPAGSCRCCVTSPPYWGLRDYGTEGQIGLEATPEEYVARMVAVFRAVRECLTDDGTLWLNLGDCYASNPASGARSDSALFHGSPSAAADHATPAREYQRPAGLKPKDLVGMPWRVAFALQADGWWLRSDIVWAKPNPMPESVTDRPTKAHEYVFLLTKAARYYFDQEAVREPGHDWGTRDRSEAKHNTEGFRAAGQPPHHGLSDCNAADGRNLRTVWTIATSPCPEAHFATMPPALAERCIRAGSAPGDTVLDPFAGSGTTLGQAVRLGRHGVGCELNPAYIEIARRRIAGMLGMTPDQVPLLGSTP